MPSWFQRLRKRQASRNEVLAARQEGFLDGLELRKAKLRVQLLDTELAAAVAKNDCENGKRIILELLAAQAEFQLILEREAKENERIAALISKAKGLEN
jgi:hypothetical protein